MSSDAPGIPKYRAVAPLATMTESKGNGLDPSNATWRRSQSTPVTVAKRNETLSARPKTARMG